MLLPEFEQVHCRGTFGHQTCDTILTTNPLKTKKHTKIEITIDKQYLNTFSISLHQNAVVSLTRD